MHSMIAGPGIEQGGCLGKVPIELYERSMLRREQNITEISLVEKIRTLAKFNAEPRCQS